MNRLTAVVAVVVTSSGLVLGSLVGVMAMTQFEPPDAGTSETLAMTPAWEPPPGDELDELVVRVARDLKDKEWVRGVFRRSDTPTEDAIVIWVDHVGRRDQLPEMIEGYRVVVEPHEPMGILPT